MIDYVENRKSRVRGLGTALITPFTSTGKVDYEALARLLDTQLTGAVDYIVVLGTTGEAATLSAEEKIEVRRFIVHYVKEHPLPERGCIPLVLGVGGNNTAQVVADLKALGDEVILDFTAVLSVCPYYNKPNQEGLFQHFCAVAKASPIPVILYNVPGRTGVNLLPETVMRIFEANQEKIIGIKEASGNLEQIKQLINLAKKQAYCTIPRSGSETYAYRQRTALLVISGDDGIACDVMEAGGEGLISVASNAFPEDFRRIIVRKDAALQAKYAEMVRLLFAEGNPVGIKAVLARKGIIQNYLRLPLVPASQELQEKIQKELA